MVPMCMDGEGTYFPSPFSFFSWVFGRVLRLCYEGAVLAETCLVKHRLPKNGNTDFDVTNRHRQLDKDIDVYNLVWILRGDRRRNG